MSNIYKNSDGSKSCELKTWQEFIEWQKQSTTSVIVTHLCYIDVAEDMVAGHLLGKILFYHLPTKNGKYDKLCVQRDGRRWLVKGKEDWWDETRLTVFQVSRALDILKGKGIIDTSYHLFSGKRKMHIALNKDVFVAQLSKVLSHGYVDSIRPLSREEINRNSEKNIAAGVSKPGRRVGRRKNVSQDVETTSSQTSKERLHGDVEATSCSRRGNNVSNTLNSTLNPLRTDINADFSNSSGGVEAEAQIESDAVETSSPFVQRNSEDDAQTHRVLSEHDIEAIRRRVHSRMNEYCDEIAEQVNQKVGMSIKLLPDQSNFHEYEEHNRTWSEAFDALMAQHAAPDSDVLFEEERQKYMEERTAAVTG